MSREAELIMIVDDSEADALLFRTALEEANIINPLVHCASYDDAVQYLTGWGKYHDRKAHPLPLFLFLDIYMPGKTGFDLLEWVRENEKTKRLIVLMMSGSASQKDIAQSYARGANSYLLKPSSRAELIKTLEHFRVFWIELNQYAY
ncbi:MAG TPA: response regulator [Opitutaceae bacterium]|nr:response regulator [Opitutaceae bacterium]